MIKCYAIVQKEHFDILRGYCESFPLTNLVNRSHDERLKYSELIETGVKLIFVDQSLKLVYRYLLERLAPYVSIIYVADNWEFSYQAFEEGALDYLVRPFGFKRFEMTINKFIKTSLMLPSKAAQASEQVRTDSFFIKPDPKGRVELLINCSDVLFIEAFQNDVAIQMADGRRFVCFYTMREMEENLSNCFMRVHKSFIINYKKMSAFDGANIIIEGEKSFKIPLGGVYKKAFMDRRSTMVIRKPGKGWENPILRKALGLIWLLLVAEQDVFNELLYI